jgi:hypothetical protein
MDYHGIYHESWDIFWAYDMAYDAKRAPKGWGMWIMAADAGTKCWGLVALVGGKDGQHEQLGYRSGR